MLILKENYYSFAISTISCVDQYRSHFIMYEDSRDNSLNALSIFSLLFSPFIRNIATPYTTIGKPIDKEIQRCFSSEQYPYKYIYENINKYLTRPSRLKEK